MGWNLKFRNMKKKKLNYPRLEGEGFRKYVDFKSTSVLIPPSSSFLRKQESRRESRKRTYWIPAFAGMTKWLRSFPYLAHVHFVHISPIFASPEGEGFPPSPKETLMEPQGQARGPQNHTHLRQGFGGSSADERNPPKRDTLIIALLSRAFTHSSTAKAVVSCVGG